ncbi:MAG: DMT family transporter [Saprospiraceae bacterium]|nr:DMT family transporter [Saprospiraceae bacterium]
MKLNRSFLELNLAIIFLSTSGVLGRLIDMAPTLIIWWRCAIAVVLMGIYIKLTSRNLRIKEKGHKRVIFWSAFLLAAHWISYFYALSLSNIAIAMLTLHTYPAMTALLEPIFLKTKFRLYHLGLSVMVLVGVFILIPADGGSENLGLAIICGCVSALAYALRNIFTRKVIPSYDGSVMMFFQLVVMTVLLLPILYFEPPASITTEWPFVGLLAIVTTCLGHTLFVHNLKKYEAVTISLLTSIVPVYGILWGVIFLSEIPSLMTVLGGIIILSAFLIESRRVG